MKGHKGGEMRLYYGRGRSSALSLLARSSPPLALARPRGQRVTTAMYYTSWRAGGIPPFVCEREKGGSCIDALVCFLFCLSCERRACFRFWTAFNNSTVVRVHVRRERAGAGGPGKRSVHRKPRIAAAAAAGGGAARASSEVCALSLSSLTSLFSPRVC